MSVLVGGVGQLYQGDFDLGRFAVERLGQEDLGPGVLVEELSYGAIAVVQRLEDVSPDAVVLVGAAERGRRPGSVERRRIPELDLSPQEVQFAVGDAATGYVSIDLVIEVAFGLGALPRRTVAVEVEPARGGPDERLSSEAAAGLEQALDVVRAEVRRAPLLELADRLRERLEGERRAGAPATGSLRSLLRELELVDEEGRLEDAFKLRDQLRGAISAGEAGEGMEEVDRALWWALIEELDRLQPLEVGWISLEPAPDGGASSSKARF